MTDILKTAERLIINRRQDYDDTPTQTEVNQAIALTLLDIARSLRDIRGDLRDIRDNANLIGRAAR